MQQNVKLLNDLIAEHNGLEGESWTEEGSNDRYGISVVCGWNRRLEATDLNMSSAKKLIGNVGRLHEEFRACMAARPPNFDEAERVDDKLQQLFGSQPRR